MTTQSAAAPDLSPYDGVLLLSFGGPEGPEQVMPFLRRVTAGRGVPQDRLTSVAEHYLRRGGVSPLPAQCRRLAAALAGQLAARGVPVPVWVAYRHTAPSVHEAIRAAHEQGSHRLAVVLTSAHPSYSGCRQYREDLAAGWQLAKDEGLVCELDKIAPYAATPALLDPTARLTSAAVEALGDYPDEQVRLLFVTHSIPLVMDELSGPGDDDGHAYTRSHLQVADEVTRRVEEATGRELSGELVFCSRSGAPGQPWLEPDIGEAIARSAADGVRVVVVVPIGFISDHMEVVEDLDTQAAAMAAEHGLRMVRVPTVAEQPEFIDGLVELVLHRARVARGDVSDPPAAQWPAVCRPGCCPNLREHRPALCGSD